MGAAALQHWLGQVALQMGDRSIAFAAATEGRADKGRHCWQATNRVGGAGEARDLQASARADRLGINAEVETSPYEYVP